jgi:hypothetical protein
LEGERAERRNSYHGETLKRPAPDTASVKKTQSFEAQPISNKKCITQKETTKTSGLKNAKQYSKDVSNSSDEHSKKDSLLKHALNKYKKEGEVSAAKRLDTPSSETRRAKSHPEQSSRYLSPHYSPAVPPRKSRTIPSHSDVAASKLAPNISKHERANANVRAADIRGAEKHGSDVGSAAAGGRRGGKRRERRNSTGIPSMHEPKVIPITKVHSAREYSIEDHIDFSKNLILKETLVKNLEPPAFIVCARSKSDSQINCIFAAYEQNPCAPGATGVKPHNLLSPDALRHQNYQIGSRSPTSPGTPRRKSRLGRPKVKLDSLMDAQIDEFAQHVKGRRKYRSTSSENRKSYSLGRYHRLGCSVCIVTDRGQEVGPENRFGMNGRLSPRVAPVRGNLSPGSEEPEAGDGESSRKSSSDENGNKSRITVPNRNDNLKTSPGPSRNRASKIPCPTTKPRGDHPKN